MQSSYFWRGTSNKSGFFCLDLRYTLTEDRGRLQTFSFSEVNDLSISFHRWVYDIKAHISEGLAVFYLVITFVRCLAAATQLELSDGQHQANWNLNVASLSVLNNWIHQDFH